MRLTCLHLLTASLIVATSLQPMRAAKAAVPDRNQAVAPQTVPLEFVERRPVVSVMINGRGPYRLIVDTGAQGNLLRKPVANEIGLEQIGEAQVASPANPNSSAPPVPVMRIDSLTIGPFTASNIRALAPPVEALPGNTDGVLSPVAFAGRLLTLDYPRATLSVTDGALPPADDRSIFEYGAENRLPVIPVTIAGTKVNLHLDSGSSGGVTLPIERAKELRLKAEPAPTRKGHTIDAEIQLYGATVDGPVSVGMFPVSSDIEFATRAPRGRVGGAVLKDFAVTLDVANRRVRFERAQQGGAAPPATLTVPAGGVDVPLRLVGLRPVVDVVVNGKGPYTFLVDTGAGGQARADSSLVDALKLEVVGEARGASGAGGQAVAMPVVRFDTLQIGGATATGVMAPSRDYNKGRDTRIDGVLGPGLFRDYLLTLDLEHGRLRIEQGSLPEPDGREIFAIKGTRGIAEVTVTVAGQQVNADIDTGAMAGITLPLSLAEKLPLASPPKVVGRAATISGSFEVSEAALKGTVMLGRHAIADPALEFTSAMPRGNIGIRVLSEFALTFDLRNQRLRLSRSATGPVRLRPRESVR